MNLPAEFRKTARYSFFCSFDLTTKRMNGFTELKGQKAKALRFPTAFQ
jgi:hypothetical protein